MMVTYLCIGSTACIKLEEYETAKVALEAGLKLAPGDLRFTKLIKECDERIAGIYAVTVLSTKGVCLFFFFRKGDKEKGRSFYACMQKD